MSHTPTSLARFTGLALTLACSTQLALAQTAPAEVFIQNAQVVGTGDTLHLYGLPTRTSEGKVSYWDATVVLEALPGGRLKSAAISSVAAPKLTKSEFVVGTYTINNNGGLRTCKLVASPFAGRTQFDLSCDDDSTVFTWYTGPIAGHPDEAAIRAAKLDTLPGAEEYSFGRDVRTGSMTCTAFGANFTARQVGDALTLNNYYGDNVLDCQLRFARSAALR
jgi:hypothetical protein